MDSKLTHVDQYKMLREEIMQSIREIGRLEVAGAIAAGGIYTWLLTHKDAANSHLAWFIVPWVLIFCGIKVLDLTLRIQVIAGYLQRIEDASFGQDPNLPGWERYKTNTRQYQYDMAVVILAAVFWVISVGASIVIAFWQRS